jgi:hypothetical protein
MTEAMTTLEVLVAARELISEPSRWTQGEYAKDAVGNSVTAISEYACCWCSVGAICKIQNDLFPTNPLEDALEAAIHVIGLKRFTVEFNDNHNHQQVMELWDKAIHNYSESVHSRNFEL